MKKVKSETDDELRAEYKRSDFGEFMRGKYANHIKEESNIVLLDPDIARAFPNDKAVNKALRYLLEVVETSTRLVSTLQISTITQQVAEPDAHDKAARAG